MSRCPSWQTHGGHSVTVISSCQPDGSWSSPVYFPKDRLSNPQVLKAPDEGGMPCTPPSAPVMKGCPPLNITYNPNDEEGTGFYCTPELSWSKLPLKMTNSTVCHLLCHTKLHGTVQCKDGYWHGHPELGFWCNKKRAAVEKWIEKNN